MRIIIYLWISFICLNLSADSTDIKTKRHHFQIGYNRFMNFDQGVSTFVGKRIYSILERKMEAPITLAYTYNFNNSIFIKLRYAYNTQVYLLKTSYNPDDHFLVHPVRRSQDVYNIEVGKYINFYEFRKNRISINPNISVAYRQEDIFYLLKPLDEYYENASEFYHDAFGIGTGLELMLETKYKFTISTQIQYFHFIETSIFKDGFFPDQIIKRNMAAWQTTIGYRF